MSIGATYGARTGRECLPSTAYIRQGMAWRAYYYKAFQVINILCAREHITGRVSDVEAVTTDKADNMLLGSS